MGAEPASMSPQSHLQVSHGRRRDIQGLRAVAIILVVLFHVRAPMPGGFVGLDIFFTLSGFVITAMILRETCRTGRLHLRNFAIRRFRRLAPALALTVSFVLIVSTFLESPFGAQQITAATGLGAMLLSANVVVAATTGGYFDAPAAHNALLNTWSLSVEEQFYILFAPLMALLAFLELRRRVPRVLAFLILALIVVTSFGVAVLTSGQQLEWPITSVLGYFGAVGRSWEFAAGALLALMADRVPPLPRWLAESATLGSLAIILLTCMSYTDQTPYPGVATLVPVAATLMLIAAGVSTTTLTSRVLSSRSMVGIGDMSYSWYLWHWPFIVFAGVLWPGHALATSVIGVALSLIPAFISYKFVELPFRIAPTLSSRQIVKIATVSFGVPITLATILFIGAASQWWMTWPANFGADASAAEKQNCTDNDFDPVRCRWNSDNGQGDLFLVGDSQADAWSDGVIQAADVNGLSTTVVATSGCPFLKPGTGGPAGSDCYQKTSEVLDFVIKTRPDLVVIANRATGYLNPWGMGCGHEPASDCSAYQNLYNAKGGFVSDPAEGLRAYREGLSGIVGPLTKAGISVILLSTAPHQPALEKSPPSILNNLGIIGSRPGPASTLAVQLESKLTSLIEKEMTDNYPNFFLYDSFANLCNANICPLSRDGVALYSDRFHLSPAGSALLSTSIAEVTVRALRHSTPIQE